MEVSLVALTRTIAEQILASEASPVAADFPSEGDLTVCAFVVGGTFETVRPSWPWGPWLIAAGAGRLVVGTAGFKGPPVRGVTEIGYGVCPSYRRRGIATAAVGLLIRIAREGGAERLTAETDADNAASQAVLRRCNFVPDDDAQRWWTADLASD